MSSPNFLDINSDGNIIPKTCERLRDSVSTLSTSQSNETDPLLRISFKDEVMYRKYHTKIHDIIKYVLASEPKETQCEHNASIVLDVNESLHESLDQKDTCVEVQEQCDNQTTRYKRRISDENLPPEEQKKSRRDIDLHEDIPNEFNIGSGKAHCGVDGSDETKESTLQICKDIGRLLTSNLSMKSKYIEFDKYIYSHRDTSLLVSKDGLTFFVPVPTGNQPLQSLFVGTEHVRMVWFDFFTNEPTVYLYLSPKILACKSRLSILPDLNDFYSKALIPVKIVFSELHPDIQTTLRNVLNRPGIIQMHEDYPRHSYIVKAFCTPPKLVDKCVSNSEIAVKYEKQDQNPTQDNIIPQEIDSSNLLMTLPCSTVRVGSHEVTKPGDLYIMVDAIRFQMPTLERPSKVMVRLRPEEIIKISYNFSGVTPVLFVYVHPRNGKSVRIVLKMKDVSGIWFEPQTYREAINKITFILQNRPTTDTVVRELAKICELEKLDNETANQLLEKTFAQEEGKAFFLKSKKVQMRNFTCSQKYDITVTRKNLSFGIAQRNSNFSHHFVIPFNIINRTLYCSSGNTKAILLYVIPSNAQKIVSLFQGSTDVHLGFDDPSEEAFHYLQRMTIIFDAPNMDTRTKASFEKVMRNLGAVKLDKKLSNYLVGEQIDLAVDEFALTPLTTATTVIIGRYKFLEQQITYDKSGIYMEILLDKQKNINVPITLKFSEMLEIRECFDTVFSIIVMYCSHSRIEQLKSLGVFQDDTHLYDLKNEMHEHRRIIILFHDLQRKQSAELRELLILSRFTKEHDFSLNKQMLWKVVPNTYIRDING